MLSLFCQRRPLGHAKAVLFIRHHQPQVSVGHAAGDQGVGADGEVDLACGQLGGDGAFCFGGGRASEQGAADIQPFQQRGKAPVVLLCQQLRGAINAA